ncbi:MAG: hypothetical protein KAR45_11920 [Desulfobacteraceae bacterium]|nr:hypothetical protein [Desulfobacteraceae bacterium]
MYKKLIDQFQSPETILKASENQLKKIDKISAKIINPYGDIIDKIDDLMSVKK